MNPRPWHDAYDPGVPREIEPDGLTLPEILARTAARHPGAPAIRFMNRTTSYRELHMQVTRFAASLVELGLQKGDRVAILLPNLPQTIVAFYGTLAAGGVAVMTNPLYVSREIESQWSDAGCTIAVTTDFLYRGPLEGIREKLPVKTWIVASIPEALAFPLSVLAPLKLRRQTPPLVADVPPAPNVHRFPALVAKDRSARPAPVAPTDLAALQYTGGTTGVAKGAMLTHANLAANAQQTASWLPVAQEGREVFLGALPFFHVFGLTVAMNFPIRIGGKIIVMPNPRDVRGLVQAITRDRVTIFPVVPAIVRAISSSAIRTWNGSIYPA
jgi:long-chain acyl-CoA synthetase